MGVGFTGINPATNYAHYGPPLPAPVMVKNPLLPTFPCLPQIERHPE